MKFPDEFEGDTHLSNADGLDPDSACADPIQCFLIQDSEALLGLVSVAASLLDPKQIPRKEKQQGGNEQQIVEKENQSAHGMPGIMSSEVPMTSTGAGS